ncbi:hypothetical protein BaRGS_00008860, partial [Batillaria attramentaria]
TSGLRTLTLNNIKPRVLCWIPSLANKLNTTVKAVNDTWVPRCDKHIFFINTDRNSSDDVVPLSVKDGRDNLAKKTMAAMSYLYHHHGRDYDWFLKGDDDAYIVMENLKFLLSHYDPATPVYLGHPYKWIVKGGYMSGGASYVISREALKLLVEQGIQKNKCRQSGSEDVALGSCLHAIGIPSYNSLDRYGRETFHPLQPKIHIVGPIPLNQLPQDRFKMVAGRECCSELTISFHHVPPDQMRIFDHLLYRTTVYGRLLPASEFQDFIKPGTVAPPSTE